MPLVNRKQVSADDIRKIIQEELENVKKGGNTKKRKRVFISHSFSKEDFKKSQRLQDILKNDGIESYLAEKDKQYGYVLSNKIREAVRDSIVIVVILTKYSILSPSVNQEVGYALGLGIPLIPVVSKDVENDIGVLLKHLEGEIFSDEDFDEKCKMISHNISSKSEELMTIPKSVNSTKKFKEKFNMNEIQILDELTKELIDAISYSRAASISNLISNYSQFSKSQINNIVKAYLKNSEVNESYIARPILSNILIRNMDKINDSDKRTLIGNSLL